MTIPDVDPARAGVTDPRQVAREFAGLPMPRDEDLLFRPERRPRVANSLGKRFPFPIPNGWFVVATADELLPGELLPVTYFGQDLVVFRTESGEPRVVDAYCPHMGAHLGVGGRVSGGTITCPFHGWRFDGASGRCVDVPYDDSDFIPKRAAVRSYPALERNRMIWAWHHLEGAEPFYDVPEVPEFHDPEWSPIIVRDFRIATCAQEMMENNVDVVHFKYVHGTDGIPDEEFVVEGHYKRSVGMNGTFVREGYGLGLGVLRVRGYTTFLSSTTPIDTENIHVRWVFTAPKALGEGVAEQAAESFCAGVSQDIPIWENKVYREHPVLRPVEKAVTEQRRWAEQFYSWPDGDPRSATAPAD